MRDSNHSVVDDQTIDRLVAGDLDESTRSALLLRLESEPDGWRRCALAFLEAQAWQSALSDLVGAARPVETSVPVAKAADRYRRPYRLLLPIARAAAVVAAFGLGWQLRGKEPSPAAAPPVVATRPGPKSRVDKPTIPSPLISSSGPPSSLPPDLTVMAPGSSLVADFEARGYRMETRPAWLISQADDPDQPARVVPLQQVQLRYIGHPVY